MMQTNIIHVGDAREVLAQMPDESVHCVVTSPPYWGLRDYGVDGQLGLEPLHDCQGWATGTPCGECFVCRMAEVFREVRRVLRKDGTCWVNMGDSYAANHGSPTVSPGKKQLENRGSLSVQQRRDAPRGLKQKDLCGMPWRVGLALQADGWWLRSDVIWAKPNPMPSSVKDRPTVAHEYLFMLSKSARYFYDHEAVREPATRKQHPTALSFSRAVAEPDRPGQLAKQHRPGREQAWPQDWATDTPHNSLDHNHKTKRRTVRPCDTNGGGQGSGEITFPAFSRSLRTIWTIPTHPFPDAHFATFPPKLAETCIKAGCPVGGVVLDPFMGSGTVGLVSAKLGRHYVGIELNPEYAAMATERIRREAGLLTASVSKEASC
ncbi:MAG: site-specific DNA-methyltransferase [Proteobacteria bacterium]|nr:site-specific DNA-methyltransferase [Pseudomonadota bacterium]